MNDLYTQGTSLAAYMCGIYWSSFSQMWQDYAILFFNQYYNLDIPKIVGLWFVKSIYIMSPDHTEAILKKTNIQIWVVNYYFSFTYMFQLRIALLLHTLQMLSTDFDPEASYLVFVVLLQFLQGDSGIVPQIWPQPLPLLPFQIHYSLNLVSLNAI